jgi:hypothetical protein
VKKLPVVGSTAATTQFCTEKLDGPEGSRLYVDGNGKITRDNGTLAAPKPNAFSLVQIETCPGSTEACRSACYVHNLQTHQGAVWDLYRHNTETMRWMLDPAAPDAKMLGEIADQWVLIMADWIRRNAAGGFRWHVSGDVFSLEYAHWIADVCREAPDVPFWIYTRTFSEPILEALVAVATINGGNLAINLSCDRDNYEQARTAAERWAWEETDHLHEGHPTFRFVPQRRLRLCYLTLDGSVPDSLGDGDVIFPDYALRPKQFATLAESPWWATLTQQQRGLVCPVDAHGKAENRRCGPCDRCLT